MLEALEIIAGYQHQVDLIKSLFEKQVAEERAYIFGIESAVPIFNTLQFGSAIDQLLIKERINSSRVVEILKPLHNRLMETIGIWEQKLSTIDKQRDYPSSDESANIMFLTISHTPFERYKPMIVNAPIDPSEYKGTFFLNIRFARLCAHLENEYKKIEFILSLNVEKLNRIFSQVFIDNHLYSLLVKTEIINDSQVLIYNGKGGQGGRLHGLIDGLKEHERFFLSSCFDTTLPGKRILKIKNQSILDAFNLYLSRSIGEDKRTNAGSPYDLALSAVKEYFSDKNPTD